MQYNKGARSILDQSGFDLVPEPQFFTPEWDPAKAEAFMADLLPKLRVPATGGKPASLGFVGVYAANDGTAGGAINAMAAAGIKQFPPVTGQDAEIQAIQRILAGEQYMTVYKSYRPEAERAAEFAVALVNGQIPKATATVNNGFKDVPSLLLDPTMITRENVRSAIVDAGLYTTDELCVQRYVPGCQTAGLG
jgi:D-xylose transport system substrate-binding protein